MEPLASVDLSLAEKRFGAAAWTVHRVDLHAELLRLATAEDGPGTPAKLRLSSEVVSALPAGSITLHDDSVHTANLVVAADGLHSVLRSVVLGREIAPPVPTGLSAFRFLIETETLEKDEKLASFLKAKSPGATILADVKETTSERHIMWYGCRE
jgi:salicylate hydroxylase